MQFEGHFLTQTTDEYISDEARGIAEKYRDLVIDMGEEYALQELINDYRHFKHVDPEIVDQLFTEVASQISKKLSDITNNH